MDSRLAFEVGSTLCMQITVVIAATLVLQWWVVDARSASRLWTACFICAIGLVAAALLLPHRRLFVFPSQLSRDHVVSIVVWQGHIATALAILWGVGVFVSVARKTLLYWQLTRFLKDCDPVNFAELDRLWPCEAESNGWLIRAPENLQILSSPATQGPFCWQLHRPAIVLPSYLLEEDDVTLRHVLLHELEHLRTRHPMQYFLQGVCSTLFWFHPLVWSAARNAELAREYLCDELAAKTAGKFGAYLRTLARVAEHCGSVSYAKVPKGTLAFGNRASTLVLRSNRLVRLARGEQDSSRLRPPVAMAALLLCAGLIQQVWLPTNAMASQRSDWSPWPRWTATALHQLDIHVRDFESFEDRVHMHELLGEDH